jgi:hypothetical protein
MRVYVVKKLGSVVRIRTRRDEAQLDCNIPCKWAS